MQDAFYAAAAEGAASVAAYAAVHSADSSDSQTSNERVEITWDPATGRVVSAANVPLGFTGTPGASATHLGLWTAETDGDWLGCRPLSGDQTFNAAGEYAVNAVSITGAPPA